MRQSSLATPCARMHACLHHSPSACAVPRAAPFDLWLLCFAPLVRPTFPCCSNEARPQNGAGPPYALLQGRLPDLTEVCWGELGFLGWSLHVLPGWFKSAHEVSPCSANAHNTATGSQLLFLPLVGAGLAPAVAVPPTTAPCALLLLQPSAPTAASQPGILIFLPAGLTAPSVSTLWLVVRHACHHATLPPSLSPRRFRRGRATSR